MHSCCFRCKVVAHQLNFLGRCRDRSWCLDPSTPDCPRNVEGTFSPSGLIGSRQIFYCISSKPKSISSAFFWKSQVFGQKTFEVKTVLLWGFKVNVTTSTPRLQYCRPVLSFNPFLRDLVLSCRRMIRGVRGVEGTRKCWFYPRNDCGRMTYDGRTRWLTRISSEWVMTAKCVLFWLRMIHVCDIVPMHLCKHDENGLLKLCNPSSLLVSILNWMFKLIGDDAGSVLIKLCTDVDTCDENIWWILMRTYDDVDENIWWFWWKHLMWCDCGKICDWILYESFWRLCQIWMWLN